MKNIDPRAALAFSEAICTSGVKKPKFTFWTANNTYAALGLSQKPEVELKEKKLLNDTIPIIRRQSGGGAVILTQDVLCFEFIAPPELIGKNAGIHESFQVLTEPVVEILSDYNIDAKICGISDLSVELNGRFRKVCGCAQLRKRGGILVHGSILVNADLSLLERYLDWPSETPDYRALRSHTDFCINLNKLNSEITCSLLATRISQNLLAKGWQELTIPAILEDEAQQLFIDKYSNQDWNLKRIRVKPKSLSSNK